jgi:hypothetical protein
MEDAKIELEEEKELKPLWPYDYEDKTTWKYSDCILTKGLKHRLVKKWILNPEFKYKHLDPSYPKEV